MASNLWRAHNANNHYRSSCDNCCNSRYACRYRRGDDNIMDILLDSDWNLDTSDPSDLQLVSDSDAIAQHG